jgi:hypothetical protein
MDLTENQIDTILNNYKNKRDKQNKYYHEVSKHKEEFKIKNRERAKSHYDNGYKEKKKQYYQDNKDILKNKYLYNYYKKNNKIEVFKEIHSEKYNMLVDKGLI